jgi:hypothetical protein
MRNEIIIRMFRTDALWLSVYFPICSTRVRGDFFMHAVSHKLHVKQASCSLLLITKSVYEFWDYVAEVCYEAKLIKT